MSILSSINTALSGAPVNPRSGEGAGRAGRIEGSGIVRQVPRVADAVAKTPQAIEGRWVDQVLNASAGAYHARQISAAAGAAAQAPYLEKLRNLLGMPDEPNGLDRHYAALKSALDALVARPGDGPARDRAMIAAQGLSQGLNQVSSELGRMQHAATGDIANGIEGLNPLLAELAGINGRLENSAGGTRHAQLVAERDRLLALAAEAIDLTTSYRADGSVSAMTQSRLTLLRDGASLFAMGEGGELLMTNPAGRTMDISGAVRGGTIGGLMTLRDGVLADARAQLDDIAAGLALGFTLETRPGRGFEQGGTSGFDVDIRGLRRGNDVAFTYEESDALRSVRLVHTSQPLDHVDAAGRRVIGLDLLAPAEAVAVALTELLPTLTIGEGRGGTLRLSGTVRFGTFVRAAETHVTGGHEPLVLDGAGLFTDNHDSDPHQKVGFAERIGVNPALLRDPGLLHADAVARQLDRLAFASEAGARLSGTVGEIIEGVIDFQRVSTTTALMQGEDRAMMRDAAAQQAAGDGNIHVEMARLSNIEHIYAANMRVVVAYQEMMRVL